MSIAPLSIFAQAPAAPTADPLTQFLPIIVIGVIMWVLLIRPQQKRQKELALKISSLKTGDRVITNGGVHGVVSNVKDGPTLVLKVDDNCKLTVDKTSIATIVAKDAKEA